MRPHPLAETSNESRLDILAGGRIEAVMNETLTILRQSLKKLDNAGEQPETAMVLNSLVSEHQMEQALNRWFDDGEVLNATYSPDRVLEKFEFLERVIEERNVKLLIVTSFEFSAVMPGARLQFMRFLKRLMMERSIRIVVMMRQVPRQTNDGTFVSAGAMGLLAFVAQTIQDIGWYRQKPMQVGEMLEAAFERPISAAEAEEHELAEHHAGRLSERVLSGARLGESRHTNGKQELLKNGVRPLKNKELAFASA